MSIYSKEYETDQPSGRSSRQKGSNYMMRSEKRPGYGAYYGKKRNRRRRRRNIAYSIFTLLLLVLLWPIGLIFLWRRRLYWPGIVKLFVSIITLAACFFLFSAALEIDTGNEKITSVQSSVSAWLDTAREDVLVFIDEAVDRSGEIPENAGAFASSAWENVRHNLADGMDFLLESSQSLKDALLKQDATADIPEKSPTPSPLPDVTSAPDAQPSAAPTNRPAATATPAPSAAATPRATQTAAADETAAVATVRPTVRPTARPTAEPAEQPTAQSAEEPAVSAAPVTQEPAPEPSLEPAATPQAQLPSALSTQVAEAMPAQTSAVTAAPGMAPAPGADNGDGSTLNVADGPENTPKPAAEAIVYHTAGGRSYHMAETCVGMTGAAAHTLADSVADGFKPCSNCHSPAAELLEAENVIWQDENALCHMSDECADFQGTWTLITLEDALSQEAAMCDLCVCDEYAQRAQQIPAATVITPTATLAPAGGFTVYHTSNGRFYHSGSTCVNMHGARPDTLENSLALGLRTCSRCNPPSADMIDAMALWVDEDHLCHTSGDCTQFSGSALLMLRSDALSAGHEGCAECGADEYLVPNSTIQLP